MNSEDSVIEVFVEELFNLCKGDDVLPVVEVGMACAGMRFLAHYRSRDDAELLLERSGEM